LSAPIINGEEFENGRISTFKVSWPWPWIASYCTPLCVTYRPLPTYQISLKSKKLFVDGRRTYGQAEGHLRLALLGWPRGVDLKQLNWLKWPLEHDTCGLEEPCIGQGWDPHGQEQCLGLSGPLTSIASVCCGVCCKSDHSVFNDGKSDWTRVSVLSSLLCDMNGIWTVTYLFQLSAKVVFLDWPSLTWSDFWKEDQFNGNWMR